MVTLARGNNPNPIPELDGEAFLVLRDVAQDLTPEMTLDELARSVGVAKSTLIDMTRRQAPIGKPRVLRRILKGFQARGVAIPEKWLEALHRWSD